MKRPSILSGIIYAIVAGLTTTPLMNMFDYFGLVSLQAPIWLGLLWLVYIVYLVKNSNMRTGAFSLILLTGVGILLCMCFGVSQYTFLYVFLVGLWLARAVIFHRSLDAILLDGAVVIIGVGVAHYLYELKGLPVATWGFFLVQSAFMWIPKSFFPLQKNTAQPKTDQFLHHAKVAEAALSALTKQI